MTDEPEQYDHDPLAQKINSELDRQAEALDAATASRLNQARQVALAQVERRPRWWQVGQWRIALAGGLMAALVVALLLPAIGPGLQSDPDSQLMPELLAELPTDSPTASNPLADLELLVEDAELAMIDELDFYLWVGAQLDPTGSDPLDDPLGDPLDDPLSDPVNDTLGDPLG